MNRSPVATPATMAQLQTLLHAASAELPRRQEQFLLPIEDRAPGYACLARVRVVLTPDLVRQILAHNAAAAAAPEVSGVGAGPIEFGGPVVSDFQRGLRVKDVEAVTQLARIIVEGRWDPAHAADDAAIAFTPAGLVCRGWRRLAAVDLADLPVTTDVAVLPMGPCTGPPLDPPGR
jgi:hypothetical protein